MSMLTNLAAKIDAGQAGIPTVGANSALQGILTTVYIAAGITAVIVIIFSGIFYTISQGDSAKIKFAKDTLLYAIIGLVVVMMAFVITNFIIGSF